MRNINRRWKITGQKSTLRTLRRIFATLSSGTWSRDTTSGGISDESSHSISDSEEGKKSKKNQKIKLLENKNLIYNLVFGLINNQDE